MYIREAVSLLSTTYQPHLAGFFSLGDCFLVCFLFYRTQNANSWTSLLRNSEKLVSGGLAPAFGTCLISLETGDQVCSHLPLASAHASAIFFLNWLQKAGRRDSAWQADAAMSELFSRNSQGCLISSATRLLLRETPMIPLII